MTLKGLKYYMDNPKRLFSFLADRGLLKWMSDERFLKISYRLNMGKKLNLKKPQTFNEKLQWLKLYDRKPIYTTMVDKYAAKKYIAERIGEEYIIPTLGVWDSFDDIDFDSLPNQFVLKCTHDSGGLVICRDKSKLDKVAAKRKIDTCLKKDYFGSTREWPYKDVKPRIIAEQYMYDATQQQGLIDYKFYCFNGEPEFLYVSIGLEDHSTATINFLNLDWTFAPFKRMDFSMLAEFPPKPRNYSKMIEIARTLSSGTSFLRVDLYEIQGQIYFSELTFSPCSGFMTFSPPEYDELVGKRLVLHD